MKLLEYGKIITNGKIYVSLNYIKDTPYMFSTTLKNHSENTMFLASVRKYSCWRTFIDNFYLGNVRFENQKIKNVTTELIKSIVLK